MLQACRPTGRLFYWALAIMAMAALAATARGEGPAEKPGKATAPPSATPRASNPSPHAASPAPQSGPALTSIIDTVYLASGTPAQGTLVITWPAFVTASGSAVAPGFLDVTLGTNGALNVQLIPNAGATPPNTYFTVVYQLQPDEVRTEYWVVPTSSPATLAQVRTTPGSGTAAQPVSMQYVNTALAAKANDDAVVHLSGAETVTGTKSFTAPPNVPAPVNTGDVANKSYVDTAVANVGVGNYLSTSGGTLTGPLTLSASPTAPLQAAPKQYVDLSAAGKADLVSGLVPTNELGSGSPSSSNCLLGNGAWGACGSSANATEIQSVPVGSSAPSNGQVLTYSSSSGQYAPATPTGGAGGVSITPAASQNIAQPAGTQFSTNNLANIRYVTPSWNWSYTDSGGILGNLTTAGSGLTITLTCTTPVPCPLGIDVASTLSGHYPVNSHYYVYAVYISGTGTPEAAPVTGGTCTSFMPRFYLESWTLGLQGIAWYYASSQAEPVSAETSYQQVYNWLQGTTLTAPCAASGTVWSCQISQNGTPYLVMWDTSQSCSGGFCTTGNQAVASQWTKYQDMTTSSAPLAISGHSVPVGIKPVLLH